MQVPLQLFCINSIAESFWVEAVPVPLLSVNAPSLIICVPRGKVLLPNGPYLQNVSAPGANGNGVVHPADGLMLVYPGGVKS